MALEINTDQSNYIKTELNLSENKTENTRNETPKKVSVDEYKKTLMDKFSFLGKTTSMSGVPTTVSISSKYLAKCANDPEQAQKLEENLEAIPISIELLKSKVAMAPGSPVVTYANFSVDANGNFSCVSGSTNDPDGKIAKENPESKKAEQKEKREEWEEKLEELRERNKEKYNELVEKIKDGSYDNKLEEFELKVYGTDIDSIIKQIEEKYEAGLPNSGSISSWDVKV